MDLGPLTASCRRCIAAYSSNAACDGSFNVKKPTRPDLDFDFLIMGGGPFIFEFWPCLEVGGDIDEAVVEFVTFGLSVIVSSLARGGARPGSEETTPLLWLLTFSLGMRGCEGGLGSGNEKYEGTS